MTLTTDELYMKHALGLAARACGRTSPNPLVGAVIVNKGRVVGEGWHQKAGTPHAEIHALQQAGDNAKDATIYVTLEPCCHYGRTGPCTEALIKAGIGKVVIAMTDPNPLVAGSGIKILRDAGIEVVEGVLAREAAQLNEVFIKWVTTGLPYIVLKAAMTLDGKIASVSGQSKWISGAESRLKVHEFRNIYDGILVGIGTILADDPELTVRMISDGKNPIRIIVDTHARIPLKSKVITDGKANTIIVVAENAPQDKINLLLEAGVEVIAIRQCASGIDLAALLAVLGERGITSILVEGGATVNASFLEAGLVDKVHWFVAPKFIGGNAAPGPVGGIGTELSTAWELDNISVNRFGLDICVSGYIKGRLRR